jgi:hypothetical protein
LNACPKEKTKSKSGAEDNEEGNSSYQVFKRQEGDQDSIRKLIPKNMKVAGRVTGTQS